MTRGVFWSSLFLLVPLTLPLWIVGDRRWQDGTAWLDDAADTCARQLPGR